MRATPLLKLAATCGTRMSGQPLAGSVIGLPLLKVINYGKMMISAKKDVKVVESVVTMTDMLVERVRQGDELKISYQMCIDAIAESGHIPDDAEIWKVFKVPLAEEMTIFFKET